MVARKIGELDVPVRQTASHVTTFSKRYVGSHHWHRYDTRVASVVDGAIADYEKTRGEGSPTLKS